MCKVCVKYGNRELTEAERKQALGLIAQLASYMYDWHYEEVLDRLLGTGLNERDLAAEEIWERGHRGD